MKNLFFAFAIVLAITAVSSAEPQFEGDSLSGWTPVGGGQWSVENGVVTGRTGDGSHGWLIAPREYGNFEMTFSVLFEDGGNSGVQIRSHLIDGVMTGYQVEVDPDPSEHNGGIYEEHGRAWLVQPTKNVPGIWHNHTWNHYRIVADGHHIHTYINGEPVASLVDDNAIYGLIALQVHSNSNPPVHVLYKDVEIRDLGMGEGWEPLFDGETLDGWEKIGEEEWLAEDGMIIGRALTDKYGYLATEEHYTNFETRLMFNAEGTGNSGLFYHSTFEGVNVAGVQCEIDPNPGNNSGGLYESAGRGWLVQPNDKANNLLKPLGEWNYIVLNVDGTHIRTWVNGLKAVDYINSTPKYDHGTIALQLHSGGTAGIRFKDFYIRNAE